MSSCNTNRERLQKFPIVVEESNDCAAAVVGEMITSAAAVIFFLGGAVFVQTCFDSQEAFEVFFLKTLEIQFR